MMYYLVTRTDHTNSSLKGSASSLDDIGLRTSDSTISTDDDSSGHSRTVTIELSTELTINNRLSSPLFFFFVSSKLTSWQHHLLSGQL